MADVDKFCDASVSHWKFGPTAPKAESIVRENFTGVDAHGHHWVNGKQVAAPKAVGAPKKTKVATGEDWRAALSPEEAKEVQRYQGAGSLLQKGLRSGEPDAAVVDRAKLLDAAIAKSPGLRTDSVLHRGLDFDTPAQAAVFLADKPVGAEFTDRGYASTSTDPNYIKDFWPGAPGPRAVRLDVQAPAGSPGAYMSEGGAAHLAHESEFLFPRGARFKVLAREPMGKGGTLVTVKFLGAEPRPPASKAESVLAEHEGPPPRPGEVFNRTSHRWERPKTGAAAPAKANNAPTAVPSKADNASSRGQATAEEHAAVIAKAKAKFKAAPLPTKQEVQEAKAGLAKLGANKYRKNLVGNSKDRAKRRAALQTEYGDGTKCPCIYCGVYVGDAVGEGTLEQDKIYTTAQGGRYRTSNLVPSCGPCNKVRGDKPFAEVIKKLGT